MTFRLGAQAEIDDRVRGDEALPKALSGEAVDLVAASVPAFRLHGLEIALRMYDRLFQDDEVRALFDQSHQGAQGSRPKALATALLAYAENIRDLAPLAPFVERIAQKHVALNVRSEQYAIVAQALLGAVGDVLGAALTEELAKAWGEAYWYLADTLIAREAEIRAASALVSGGWSGLREFRIDAVEPESETITSFRLSPVDGGTVLRHKPGQYLPLLLDVPGHGMIRRTYSISCAPNEQSYRVTVKRESSPQDRPDLPPGLASGWFHEHARVGTIVRAAAPVVRRW